MYLSIKTDLTPAIKECDITWLLLANNLALAIHAVYFIEKQYQNA